MPSVTVKLSISPEECERYYSGEAQGVACTSEDGLNIRFPADKLRPFMTYNGVRGVFNIEFSSDYKFLNMRRLS